MFLAPMAMAVGAALTVPVLIALYLLKLRRRPVRVSTVMFWPVAARDVQANVPLARLRPSWLFFLHVLLLALLLGAMGRPAIESGAASGGRVVLMIDTSASMSARDAADGPTRLDRARERALELAAQARRTGGGSRVAIVAFAKEPVLLTGFTASRSIVEAAMESVTATDQPADVVAALRVLGGLAEGESETSGPVTTVIISDGSFIAGDEPPLGIGRVLFERIGRDTPPINTGLTGLAARRDDADPSVIRVLVSVLANSAATREATISLAWNGQPLGSRVIPLALERDDATTTRGVAEFEVSKREAGVLTAWLPTSDALSSDNTASLVLEAPRSPSIVLVTSETPGELNNPGSRLLKDVLEELGAASFEHLSSFDYESAVIERRMMANLVVFDRTSPRAIPNAATLSFGAAPAVAGLTAGALEAANSPPVLWNRKHPVLRHVSLDSLVVKRRLPLTLDAAGPWRDIARTPDGPLIAAAEIAAHRHIVVGLDLSATNWPVEVGFPIFIAAAADYLTLRAEASLGQSFRTGDPIALRARGPEIVLDGPARLVLSGDPASGQVGGGPAPRAGVYLSAGSGHEKVAVNVFDEIESTLASPQELDVAGRAIPAAEGDASPREVWHWFIIAALGLLVVEWFVYARAVRI